MASPVEKFEINLEHDIDEQYQYEPGEFLRGNVSLVIVDDIKVKAVQVQLKGEATVSWEEEGKANPFRADETYIDITQNLLEAPPGENLTVERGQHRFPLEFRLPPNLPSSFIGKFGSVTYVAKATLKEDKRFGLSTMITSEPFLVLRKLDLSLDPNMQLQQQAREDKRLWGACAFCISGRITAEVTLNKVGHLPGEDVYLDAEISNDSPRIVQAVQAAVVMHSTFHAKHKTRYNSQIVNKKRDEWEMSFGEGRRWRNVRITIPPYIPESRLDCCDIIDIRYELLFKCEISGKADIKISMPLTIGTTQNEDGHNAISDHDANVANGMDNKLGQATGDDKDSRNMNEYVLTDGFRSPLEHGETRRNPLYSNNVNDI